MRPGLRLISENRPPVGVAISPSFKRAAHFLSHKQSPNRTSTFLGSFSGLALHATPTWDRPRHDKQDG